MGWQFGWKCVSKIDGELWSAYVGNDKFWLDQTHYRLGLRYRSSEETKSLDGSALCAFRGLPEVKRFFSRRGNFFGAPRVVRCIMDTDESIEPPDLDCNFPIGTVFCRSIMLIGDPMTEEEFDANHKA